MLNQKCVLIVLDGWGYRAEKKYNAIAEAATPFYDFLLHTFPHGLLEASGTAVGLPMGEMGNSEVGHMTIGAGRVLENDVVRISHAVQTGGIKENEAIQTLCEHIKKFDSTLHIQGLLSPGGVHSHEDHLFGILRFIKDTGIKKVVVHAFLDGRDTAPQSGGDSLHKLEALMEELGIGVIGTMSGRYYAMDRDNNWERVEKTDRAIFEGVGNVVKGVKATEHIQELYTQEKWDEHIEPVVFLDENGENFSVKQNDGILFFNFRADRARMISKKILDRSHLKNLCFVTLTEYDAAMECLVAFPPLFPETTLAAEISAHGFSQVHIAETEKYAHATYFLNGKKEIPHENEEFLLIESHKDVPTHDLAPEMRAKEIADATIDQMQQQRDFLFVNFANADMVGHTAHYDATKRGIESIDLQLKRIFEIAQKEKYILFITSDHGNAEVLFDEDGGFKHTAHTNNPVPYIVTAVDLKMKEKGSLIDVAPTILALYGIEKPKGMTGKNLIEQ